MNTIRNKQSGSTLIGFVSGLVIGLGIAVVVAIVITKTPVPFLNNKPGKMDKPGELSSAQAGDPNKPLYGKQEAVREAARDMAKETAPAEAVQAAGAVPAVVQAKADVGPAAPAAAAPARADEDKYLYYLQAGAFREQADAEGARAKLALQGFEASISEKSADAGGGTLYRVRLGPFSQLDAMNKVRSKLAEGGTDVAVVRMAKQ